MDRRPSLLQELAAISLLLGLFLVGAGLLLGAAVLVMACCA